jgi:hypothetical protein
MTVYFLMFHVKPNVDNNEDSVVKGAYANCLILSNTIGEAEAVAILKIKKLDWQIIELEEGYEVTESDYVDNAKDMEMYEQALIDKEVYTLHTYESENETTTKRFSQDEHDFGVSRKGRL